MAEGVFDFYSFLMGGISAEPQEELPYEPLQFPLDPPSVGGLRSLQFYSDFYTMSSESPFNGKRQTYASSGERWRATLELAKMSRRQAGLWEGFLLNLQGGYNSFLFGDVFHPTPLGSPSGTPRIKGGSQLGRTIETDGWTANEWGLLLAGDMIEINGRLHKVTRDVNSDASGNATLDVFPSVITSPADNIIILTSDCKGVFTLANPILTLSQINITGIREGLTFEIVEVI